MEKKQTKITWKKKTVVGMIHVPALPGTPAFEGSTAAILDKVMQEQQIYCDAGIDALMIENMHDTPYLKRTVGPEITALMTLIGYEVKKASNLPCGIQVLAGANQAALAAALGGGLDFIRAEGFVYGHVADEGVIESDAGALLRYRKAIGAEHIAIFTDLKKKHSAHAITGDVSLKETAEAAEFFRSDGLIITGSLTGKPPSLEDFDTLNEVVKVPLMAGSGVSIDNVEDYLSRCDAVIVGSWFKQKGHWANDLDPDRITAFMTKVKEFRNKVG